jgi:hypothetical protein
MLERSFSRDQSQSGQTHFHDLLWNPFVTTCMS